MKKEKSVKKCLMCEESDILLFKCGLCDEILCDDCKEDHLEEDHMDELLQEATMQYMKEVDNEA